MRQYIGVVIAFLLLPVELKLYPKIFKKKAQLGPVLCLTGLIMAAVAALPIGRTLKAFTDVFTKFSTLQTLIVVVEIGVLGNLLKQYGILEKIVSALEKLIPSKKVLIMIMPAIMGLLPVPGGAFLSAPFVDSIGNDLKMGGTTKSVVNLYFRHCALFLLPYNTTMLAIASTLPEINVYHVIALNLAFVAVMELGAYFMYVRPCVTARNENLSGRGQAVKEVLMYLSPIYMALVFNTVFGLQMYQAIFLCILLTFLLKGKDKSQFLKHAAGGLSVSTLVMLVGVYFMQNVIKSLDIVMAGVGGVLSGSSMLTFMLIVPVVGLVFGLATGLSLVPMGMLLPFVAGMGLSPLAQAVYAFYILVWSFLGYYFSPFHLCQLLTIKYMGCDSGPVYKKHAKMMPILAVTAVLLFSLYNMILI